MSPAPVPGSPQAEDAGRGRSTRVNGEVSSPQRATRAGIEDVELSLNVVSQSEGESNRDAGDNQDDSGGGQIGQEVVEQDEDEDEDEDDCYLDPKLAVIWYSGAMEALKNTSPQAFEEYMQGLRHRGVDPEERQERQRRRGRGGHRVRRCWRP